MISPHAAFRRSKANPLTLANGHAYFQIQHCKKPLSSPYKKNGTIAPTRTHIDEADIVKGLKAKDPAILEYLYDHYSPALHGIIFRVIKEKSIAEEVLQDVFLKIWDKIDSYDPVKGRLFTWMYNLARNQAIDKTRSKEISQYRKTGELENLVSKIDRSTFSEQSVEAIGLVEVLNRLPAEQRFVIEKLYLQGYSQSEVAKEFDLPLGTVKTRTRAAMTELRTILKVS